MADINISMKPGCKSPSADGYQKITLSGSSQASTIVSKSLGGVIEFVSAAPALVSIGTAPNTADAGAFAVPGDGSLYVVEGVPVGMKVAVKTA